MLYLSGFGGDNNTPTMLVYENAQATNLIAKRYEKNNSWLCECGNFLVSINEASPVSTLYLLSKNAADCYDSLTIEGGNLCHLSYIQKSGLLVGACYVTGNIFWLEIDHEHKKFSRNISYHTQGDTQGRAHCVVPNEAETLLLSANIMQDRIYRYAIGDSELSYIDFLQLPIGVGPRHILPLDAECNSYYIITEYSNELLLIENNTLTERYGTLSSEFCGISNGSTLCMTKPTEGKQFLYAGNRGENSIAIFEVLSNLSLRQIGRFDCGDFPRHIALVENDKYIVSANQHGNNFSIFELDPKSGMSKGKIAEIPMVQAAFALG